jgi:hypothetical protein
MNDGTWLALGMTALLGAASRANWGSRNGLKNYYIAFSYDWDDAETTVQAANLYDAWLRFHEELRILARDDQDVDLWADYDPGEDENIRFYAMVEGGVPVTFDTYKTLSGKVKTRILTDESYFMDDRPKSEATSWTTGRSRVSSSRRPIQWCSCTRPVPTSRPSP